MDTLDETIAICNNIILSKSKNPRKHDLPIIKNLLILAQRLQFKRPHFSAYGFFPIDHATLFIISNITSSYLVVMLQYDGSLNFW